MSVLASFTAPISSRPGSACKEITFMLRRKRVLFGFLHKFTIERVFYEYVNCFAMSNGEEPIIGRIHDTQATYWDGNKALDVFLDLQIELMPGETHDSPI